MLRLLTLVLALAGLTVLPFLIFGAEIEASMSQEGVVNWMRDFGTWAWLAGIALIALDIALPIPASAVMAALGIIYGPVIGGMVSASGSILAGLAGYGVCRMIGPERAQRLAGAKGFEQAVRLFDSYGGWIVAGSRWLPVLPETISFLAGLTAMPFGRYLVALMCGSVSLGFAFAMLGHLGSDNLFITLLISAFAPLLLWLVARPFLVQKKSTP